MGCGVSAHIPDGHHQIRVNNMDRSTSNYHVGSSTSKQLQSASPLFPPPSLSPRQMMATPTQTPTTGRIMRSGIGAFMPYHGLGDTFTGNGGGQMSTASVVSRQALSKQLHSIESWAALPSPLITLILDYHIVSRIVLAGGRFSSGSTATTRPLSLHPFSDRHWIMGPAAPVMRPDLPHLTYHHPSQALMMIAGSQWDASDASWHLSIHDMLVDEDSSSLWFAKSWDDPHHFLSLYRRNAASVIVPHSMGSSLHLIGGEVTMMYLSVNNHIYFDGQTWKKYELGMEGDGRTGATAAYCKDTNTIYLAG
jgi:hypothetical protein